MIAVIIARGGSKRIPRKNIREFHGKPIIAYSIDKAFASKIFDRVIVSTDDDEIIRIGKKHGAEIPFIRPKELSDDRTTTLDVMQHAVAELNAKDQFVCCIYATAPFLDIGDLEKGIELLGNNPNADYSFPVTTFPFPIQRAIKVDTGNKLEMFYPQHEFTRSQDLEEAYHDAGQFYWGRGYAWYDKKPIYSSNALAVKIPRYRVQDVDTEEDWVRAEFLYFNLFLKKNK